MSDEFVSSSEAFRKARARASVAAALEAATLHTAIRDAQQAGLSVRQAAAALRVPKSTVARHWRAGHTCSPTVPIWGSPEEWQDAQNAVWSHDPDEIADAHMPWQWTHHPDGTFTVRHVSQARDTARLRD